MWFVIIMFLVLCVYAYVETHAAQIVEEIQINRLIRQSYEDARHIARNPVRNGYAGYHPWRWRA